MLVGRAPIPSGARLCRWELTMAAISLARLRFALEHLSLTEQDLIAECPSVEKLLERQRRLDRLQPLVDKPQPSTNDHGWFAGVDHLRRRLAAYGPLQSRQIEHFLRFPPLAAAAGETVRLVILFSVVEPGLAADVVLEVALRLGRRSQQ